MEMVDERTNCMGETIARTSPVRRCVRSPVRMPSKKAMSCETMQRKRRQRTQTMMRLVRGRVRVRARVRVRVRVRARARARARVRVRVRVRVSKVIPR